MIGKLTSSIARTFALALTICATGGASAAAKPIAVWNGDFTVLSRGGVTVYLNGNSNSDGNLTITDSSSLGTTAGGGVYFEIPSAKRGKHLTTVIGANLSSVDFSATRYLMTFTQGNAQNKVGACLNTSRKFVGIWNGDPWNATTMIGTSAWPTTDTTRYIGYIYNPTAPDTSNSGVYGQDGSRIFVDASSTADYNQSTLRDSANTVAGVTIGGYRGANSSDLHTKSLTNAKIKFIALFTEGDYATADDVVYWSLTDMTKTAATFAGSDANTGVNVPASGETISAATTAAAVFVQDDARLTFTGSGVLTIGGGTGPLYVADGASLNIDASAIPLSVSNPTYTIISGAIMGTVSVTALPTAPEGYTAVACVTDVGVAVALQKEVSITSPFDGTTLASPRMATIRNSDAAEVSFGNDMGYWQMVDGNDAVVAKVTGGTYTKVNGYLNNSETPVISGSVAKYLVMSGGTADYVKGVQEAHWGLETANQIQTTGDAILQLEGSASVNFAFGAGDKGGYTGAENNKRDKAKVTGSTGVTIKGVL